MLKSKTIRKEPKESSNWILKDKRKRKKIQQSSVKSMTLPLKYSSPHDFFLFYCDVPLIIQDGKIKSEISLFNRFKLMKNIYVNQKDSKEIVISLESNRQLYVPHWSYEVERMENSEGPEIQEWASKIRTFCQKYEENMREIEDLTQKASPEQLKLFDEINKTSTERIAKLKESGVYVQFKLRLTEHNFQCESISLGEEFVKELGYTTDTFVSTVLQEGLPQLTSFDDEVNLIPIKLVMENYLSISKEGYESPEFGTTLIMRSGYTKQATNKTYVMMNFEKKSIGIEVISVFYDTKEPVLDYSQIPSYQYNSQFLDVMSKKEKERSNFLKKFYNETIPLRYTYHDKVCRIRELPNKLDEEILS